MNIGRLDRLVTIRTFTTVQDDSGQDIETPVDFAEVRAHRKDVRGAERFTSRQELATRTVTYRIRWMSGINEKMSVVDEGNTYAIVGISDSRRQGWMELSCEVQNPTDS